jgi:hypothetical protein
MQQQRLFNFFEGGFDYAAAAGTAGVIKHIKH